MIKNSVFFKNIALTSVFFEKYGVKPPKYGKTALNLFKDILNFVGNKYKKSQIFFGNSDSERIFHEMKGGGLFLTAHYGNFEALGFALFKLGLPLSASFLPQKPKVFDNYLKKKRTFNGKSFVNIMSPKETLQFLDKNGLFALLADQDFRKKAQTSLKNTGFFLKNPVRCNPLPLFILQHRPQTPVFCGYLQQTKGEQRLFLQRIPSENVYQHYHNWLESLILQEPNRWYGWFHRRFLKLLIKE